MPKINQEEYEILKSLDEKWKWIARDKAYHNTGIYTYSDEPYKESGVNQWLKSNYVGGTKRIDSELFHFIQWEDKEPYHIQGLIDEYESEETEVSFKEKLKQEVDKIVMVTESYGGFTVEKEVDVVELFELIDRLDEPESKNISLQDVTQRLWELPSNNRKDWLEQLNNEFQEGYIVPLGLKTTDGEEQYLTLNGSYFACRRNRDLQQTFATLEEIPEFYRELAERVL